MRVSYRVLLETDGPYMPLKKGGISHPGDAIHIAQCVARLKGIDCLTVLEQTRRNVSAVYENMDFGTYTLLRLLFSLYFTYLHLIPYVLYHVSLMSCLE